MNQDALIPPGLAGMPQSFLAEVAEKHVARLRELNAIRPEHELSAALVLHLAQIAGMTSRGYAAAQVARELREAIAALPVPEEPGEDEDELARALEGLVRATD